MNNEELSWSELENRSDLLYIQGEDALFVNHHKLDNVWMLIGKKEKTALRAVECINEKVSFRTMNVRSLEGINYILVDFFFAGVKKLYKIKVEEDYNNIFFKLIETSKVTRKYLI